jgi:hypothetical protein
MTPYDAPAARDSATRNWSNRLAYRNRSVAQIRWTQTTTPDGTPMVSGRIDHPHAAELLLLFVKEGPLVLAEYAGRCQQPTFDHSMPGRTSCLWLDGGVWVELWHPDTAPAAVVPPAQDAPTKLVRLLRTHAGDRLPFTRRTPSTEKEPTA